MLASQGFFQGEGGWQCGMEHFLPRLTLACLEADRFENDSACRGATPHPIYS